MLSTNNLKKPDNKKWKQIADIALYSLPFLSTAVLTTPLTDSTQKWLLTLLNVIIVVFKAVSKFTTDEQDSSISTGSTSTV